MSTKWKAMNNIVSAEQLCRFASMAKMREEKKKVQEVDNSKIIFEEKKHQFELEEFREDEFEKLERKIIEAAKNGRFEVEVMKFPAGFCTDKGRAINNREKRWKETLTGKAKSFYLIFQELGEPNGYRLKAKINGFPGGFIGDISILIDWS